MVKPNLQRQRFRRKCPPWHFVIHENKTPDGRVDYVLATDAKQRRPRVVLAAGRR
jgi:hypothetical protein